MAHARGGNRRRKGEKAVFRSDDLFSVPVKTLMAEKCTRGKNTRGDENTRCTRGKNTRGDENTRGKNTRGDENTRGKNTRGDENTRGKNTRDNKNIPTIKIYATVKSHDVRKAW